MLRSLRIRSSRLPAKNISSISTLATGIIPSSPCAKTLSNANPQDAVPVAPMRSESLTLTLSSFLPKKSSSPLGQDPSKNSDESNVSDDDVDLHDKTIYEHLHDKTFNENKYGIYNEKNKTNDVNKTKISFLYHQTPSNPLIIEKEVKKSITDAIEEISKGSNESKLKFYQYLAIAIKCGGVNNQKDKYEQNLQILNKEISEDKDKFYFSKAKKLSLLFQENSKKNNIFTGRIDEGVENINVVGMRTKRIPLELLSGLAIKELKLEDFEKFQKFLSTQFPSSQPVTVFSSRANNPASPFVTALHRSKIVHI
jgi:hypothetical protein